MPPRSWQFRIDDILQSIANIETYLTGLDFDAFQRDQRTIDAVVRNWKSLARQPATLTSRREPRCRTSRGNRSPPSGTFSRTNTSESTSLSSRTVKQDLVVLQQQLQPKASGPSDDTLS